MIYKGNTEIPCVSFEFLFILNTERGENFYLFLKNIGVEVKIYTDYHTDYNDTMLADFMKKHNFPKKHLHFTTDFDKHKFLLFDLEVDVHVDSYPMQRVKLRKWKHIKLVSTHRGHWELEVLRYLSIPEEEYVKFYVKRGFVLNYD